MSLAALQTNPAAQATSGVPAELDFKTIKQRQQATWASGDFAIIGTTLQIVGETLAEAADIRTGEQVLDVATGNGNAALAAARRFARVTATDYVPQLLDKAAARAQADGLRMAFKVADAEALPFEASSFDVVLSTFGAMFAPDQRTTAREMLRVTRGGGRIAMANWTPEGLIGHLFRLIGRYVPPPAGLQSPALWGSEPHIVELFGARALDIRSARKHFNFRYRSPEHFIDVFRTYYGPTHKAFAALYPEQQAKLSADITALLQEFNRAGETSLVVPSEYLEVVITKK